MTAKPRKKLSTHMRPCFLAMAPLAVPRESAATALLVTDGGQRPFALPLEVVAAIATR